MHYIIPPEDKICTHREHNFSNKADYNQLEAIKIYGAIAQYTDFAALQLICPFSESNDKNDNRVTARYWVSAEKILSNKNRCLGGLVTQLPHYHEVRGMFFIHNIAAIGLRPMLTPATTKYIFPNDIKQENGRQTDKIHSRGHVIMATYGSYPQTMADKETSDKLTIAFHQGNLQKTSKTYTHTTREYTNIPVQTYIYPEYEFEGTKYVRVIALDYKQVSEKQLPLSDGSYFKKGNTYWIKVEPVEWLTDKSGYWMTKKIITGGIPYFLEDKSLDTHSDSFAYQYLNTHFKNDFEQNIEPRHLLAYQLYLCETLSKSTIPNGRVQYMQTLSNCVQSFTKQYTVQADLLKEIKIYTRSLMQNFMQSADLTPQTHITQLQTSIFNQKETTLKTMINRQKPSFWSKMTSLFQHTRA